MATIEAVPELADKGFWYFVAEKVITTNNELRIVANMPSGSVYSAWRVAGGFVTRTADPLVGVDTLDIPSSTALALLTNHRPHARIRGR